jgi:hypothetical protein
MKLPKIDRPIFELVLPSNKEIVKYTSFTVKEEKILLIAQESNDMEQAILAIKQIVNNCLIDKNIEDFSMFDLEYVLLKLRSKSIDNNIKFGITDPDTKENIELELDLEDVKVVTNENHSARIRINEDYVLFMRYPTINEFTMMAKNGSTDTETNFKIMINCMDKLVSEEQVFKFSEFNEDDINEFLDNLDADIINKIKIYFETMPKLRHEIKYTNNTGTEKTFVIEGIQTFFI